MAPDHDLSADGVGVTSVIEMRDDRLAGLIDLAAALQQLAGGYLSLEGPVWVPRDGGYLLFSEVRGDARHRFDERGVRAVEQPSLRGVGMTLDASGRLIVCEHNTHSLVAMQPTGTGAGREPLARHFEGRELNSPNDVVVHSDGSIWFTDPPGGRTAEFGIDTPRQLDFQGVFRRDRDGTVGLIADDFAMPNGLCFSPGETLLYVNDTSRSHIRAFELGAGGVVRGQTIVRDDITTGTRADGWVDGMKCDEHGNIWVTGPHGIWILDPGGRHLGTIRLPEPALNLHWGGPTWSELYITGRSSLYRISTRTAGRREPFMCGVPVDAPRVRRG